MLKPNAKLFFPCCEDAYLLFSVLIDLGPVHYPELVEFGLVGCGSSPQGSAWKERVAVSHQRRARLDNDLGRRGELPATLRDS